MCRGNRRFRTTSMAGIALLALVAPAEALQQHEHGAHGERAAGLPAALTAEEARALREGEGMGMALAAELNHYPGPKHVLELAEGLGITPEVHRQVEAIREAMLAEARRLGEEIIEAEGLLDRRFAHDHIDEAALRELTGEIARLRGELRAAHLVAHLQTTALLSPEQIVAYDRLRGHGGAGGHNEH